MKFLNHKASIILLAFFMTTCKTLSPVSEVVYMDTTNGVLNLRSTGSGKTKEDCILNAQKNAFETLFFRGIPGSQQNTALIGPDEKSKLNNSKYFEEFYEKERFKTFLTGTQEVSQLQKVAGGKQLTISLGINLPALRKDLENTSIIRKFGY